MSSPWLVPTSGSIERDEIERAYRALLAGDAAASGLERVRPVVRESWTPLRRPQGARAEGLPELELSGDALEAYRAGHPLSATLSLIRTLLLPGASDDARAWSWPSATQQGRLLWIEGDRMLRSRAGDMGFVEGANWSETRVGTAAPGTALALGALGAGARCRALQSVRAAMVVHRGARTRPGDGDAAGRDRRHRRQRGRQRTRTDARGRDRTGGRGRAARRSLARGLVREEEPVREHPRHRARP